MSRTLLCALCASLLTHVSATPEDFLITSLPGLTFTPNFKQYAGYMPLNDSSGTELFFWFVESQRNPLTDPLLLWMNGGPGASSIQYGFWSEHGPYLLSLNGTLTPNPYSWNREANIIYLEAPSGVGFSFSRDETHYKTGDLQTARDNYAFLVNWFNTFPQFRNNEFLVTGESYGGHYVPTLSLEILTNGLNANMSGFFIGNPGIQSDWFYNIDEYAFITQLWSNGFIPEDVYLNVYSLCGWSDFLTNCSKNFTNPTPACVNAAQGAWSYLPARWDPYDLLAPTCHTHANLGQSITQQQTEQFYKRLTPKLFATGKVKGAEVYNPCLQNWPPSYMNRVDVQQSIHAYPKRTNVPWPDTPAGWDYSSASEYADISLLFPVFFDTKPNWRIMIYSGTSDASVPFQGTEKWMNCVCQAENCKVKRRWHPWWSNGDVGGHTVHWDKMDLVTVKGCGHMVPMYCPRQAFDMFQQWMNKSL